MLRDLSLNLFIAKNQLADSIQIGISNLSISVTMQTVSYYVYYTYAALTELTNTFYFGKHTLQYM